MLNIIRETISLKSPSVLVIPSRFRQFNTRSPRPHHYKFQLIQGLVKPKLPPIAYDKHYPKYLLCRKQFENIKPDEEEYPYARIIANEIRAHLDNAKMILVLHPNSVIHCHKSKREFYFSNMTLMWHGKSLMRMAMENSKFESLITLFHKNTNTYIVTCPEVKIRDAYKLLKKMPYYLLMGGVVQDKFLRRHQLDELSEITDIGQLQSQLVHTMESVGTQLVQKLTQHQMLTVAYLNQYVEIQTKKSEESPENIDATAQEPPSEENK